MLTRNLMAARNLIPLPLVQSPPVTDGRADVDIYKPFFLAGILSVLTAGCALGALALFGIAARGTYLASAWTPYVLAHANSQLYGWVGFFVMGFALQQHAPRQSKARQFHQLAVFSLTLMAFGIVLRFLAEPLIQVAPSVWTAIGALSGVLQAVAVAAFMLNTTLTRFKSDRPMEWQTKFVFASLASWLAVAVAEPFTFIGSHRPGMEGIAFVGEWFPVLREAQFLGFVAMMIYGVALVKMNSCFGARPAYRLWGEVGFTLWIFGLALRCLGWLHAFRSGFAEGSLLGYQLGGTVLACAAACIVIATRLFEALDSAFSSHKFVRGAFTWLLIAGVMLILEPAHLNGLQVPFSHAYTGAIRHAVTVGFISQMILGVGLHVVSRMNRVPDSVVPSLWPAFWLLNFGNAMRVSLEVATDWTPRAFGPMGLTGFIELTALIIWASTVVRILVRQPRLINS